MLIRDKKISDVFPVFWILQTSFSDWYKKVILLPLFYYVAEVDGKAVGFVIPRIKNNIREIYRIAIDTGYRNMGIGNALLEKGLEHFRDGGIKKCIAWVRPDNIAAEKMYMKGGFKKKSIIKKRIIGEDLQLMELQIND